MGIKSQYGYKKKENKNFIEVLENNAEIFVEILVEKLRDNASMIATKSYPHGTF